MSSVYDDEESEDGDEFVPSGASRRLVAARGESRRALQDAVEAALKTSHYAPWLLGAALVAMLIAVAAMIYGVVGSFGHVPQGAP